MAMHGLQRLSGLKPLTMSVIALIVPLIAAPAAAVIAGSIAAVSASSIAAVIAGRINAFFARSVAASNDLLLQSLRVLLRHLLRPSQPNWTDNAKSEGYI